MEGNQSVSQLLNELIDVCTEMNPNASSTAVAETHSNNHMLDDRNEQDDNIKEIENEQSNDDDGQTEENIAQMVGKHTANEQILLKINQINTDIDFAWKIQAAVNCQHPKRKFNTETGTSEVSTWDLVDDTGCINLVAFNLNSYTMSKTLVEGKSFEFDRLSIRTVDDQYRTLPNEFQLLVTNATNVREIALTADYRLKFDFTHLDNIEKLPLNSIIDVDVSVVRDYGITTGSTNNNAWSRRELHVGQDGVCCRLTLWNEKAKMVKKSMINMHLKLKNVKVSWFNGTRTLVTLGNTHLSII